MNAKCEHVRQWYARREFTSGWSPLGWLPPRTQPRDRHIQRQGRQHAEDHQRHHQPSPALAWCATQCFISQNLSPGRHHRRFLQRQQQVQLLGPLHSFAELVIDRRKVVQTERIHSHIRTKPRLELLTKQTLDRSDQTSRHHTELSALSPPSLLVPSPIPCGASESRSNRVRCFCLQTKAPAPWHGRQAKDQRSMNPHVGFGCRGDTHASS